LNDLGKVNLLFAALLCGAAFSSWAGESGTELLPEAGTPSGGDSTLQSAAGAVALHDFRGKVALLNFGYTHCPDICPLSLGFMAQALDTLNDEELQHVQGLFVTVDPLRDTADLLHEYTNYFHEKIIGLTGSEAAVDVAAKQYGVQYFLVRREGDPADEYAVNHSAATYLITPQGVLRFIFPHATPPTVVRDAVRHVLAGN